MKYNENQMKNSFYHSGQLKIFLGYAHGCGKTYAMLDAALRRQADGARVLIASTYTREEIPPIFQGLLTQTVAESSFDRGLDFEQIILHHPDLVVVDGLSEDNPEGSRHPKRYMDVLELLEKGIDVFTTLDIYQLESLRDASWQCQHLGNPPMVPDRIFDQADIIEFVDIPPEELLERLATSPAHLMDHSREEILACYSLERLRAMREAAMRRMTGRLQTDFKYTAQREGINQHVAIPNRILVCISSHPLAERLVRAGRRMADEMNSEWMVLYIETPERIKFSSTHSEQLEKTLALAAELGAQVIRAPGYSISRTILDFARNNQITRIIIGNPRRKWWQDPFGGTLVDRVIRQSGLIDVYVISDDRGVIQPGLLESMQTRSRWVDYLKAVVFVVIAAAISYPLHFWVEPSNMVVVFLTAVVFSAMYAGRGPSLLASVISVLFFDFFMVEPKLSLTVYDTQYLITLFGFFIVSVVISNMVATIKSQVEESQRREAWTNALYNLSRGLASAIDTETILHSIIDQLQLAFRCESCVLISRRPDEFQSSQSGGFKFEEGWESIAAWVADHNQPAGYSTTTFPSRNTYYHPLASGERVIGVLGIQFLEPDLKITAEKKQLLEAYAAMAALAYEKTTLSEQANISKLIHEKEKLQTALLNSISHDLRTPLAAITGVLSTLHETEVRGQFPVDPALRADLIDTGWEEADRLNRLVGNLLDMTRLESGAIHLHIVEADLVDIIGSVQARMRDQLADYKIQTEIPSDLPLIPMDTILIEQVLVNLLDNAIKFSQTGTGIIVTAELIENSVMVSVRDYGKSIPAADLEHIFDKFYRGKSNDRISGSGLGLAICKGFIEIHHGKIWAENMPPGGVCFRFTLPLVQFSQQEGST